MRYRNVAKLKLYLLEQDANSFAQFPVWYYVKSRSGLSVNTVLQLWQIFYKFFWQNILSSATNEDDSLRTHCTCLRANPLVIVGPRKGKSSDKFFTRVGWVLKYHSFELAWNIITLKWACPTLFLGIEHKQKIFSITFCKYLYHSFEDAHFTQAQSWRGLGPSHASHNPSWDGKQGWPNGRQGWPNKERSYARDLKKTLKKTSATLFTVSPKLKCGQSGL